MNAKEARAGDGHTQFGRAMHELNIDVICANSPAAKGRVERAHLTLGPTRERVAIARNFGVRGCERVRNDREAHENLWHPESQSERRGTTNEPFGTELQEQPTPGELHPLVQAPSSTR